MNTKTRIQKLEDVKIAKPGLNVAMLKPSEIVKRVRAILTDNPALATDEVIQSLSSIEAGCKKNSQTQKG